MRAWRVNDGSVRPFALSIGQITVPLSRKNLPFSAAKCRRGAFNERLSLEVKGGCHVQSASSRRLCCGHEPFARLCRGRVHRRAYGANGQDDRRHEGRGREEGSDHASRHVEGRDEEGQRSRLHGAYAGSPQGHGSVSPSRFRRGKSILRPRLALDGLVPGKRLPRQAVARAPRPLLPHSQRGAGSTRRTLTRVDLASGFVPRLKERVMTKVLNEVLAANETYAGDFGDKGKLPLPPGRRFAILTCMDARLDPAKFAGLKEGDAHVIRNAGGRASDDAIRSLIISHKLLGTNEWFVIHHTDCGMQLFTDDIISDLLSKSLQTATVDESGWRNQSEDGGSDESKYITFLTF